MNERGGLEGLVRVPLARQAGPRELPQFVIDFRQHLVRGTGATVLVAVGRHRAQIMTPDAIRQLKASYAAIAAQPGQLAARFYEELFKVSPELRPLFPTDLALQQGHFEAALAMVVRNLEEVHALRESLRDLGA